MQQETLLYNLKPTKAQFRVTLSVALALLGATIAALPFRNTPFVRIDAFIPLYDLAVLLGDWITATLLFAQAAVLRSKALVALATGYFFTGLIIIPHALAFPFAFSPDGLLPGGLNNTVWLYVFWHLGLPVSVIAYSLLKHSSDWPHTGWPSPKQAIIASVICAAALAAALTLLATLGAGVLPSLMPNSRGWHLTQAVAATAPLLLLTGGAMALSWRRRSSVLDLWLLLVLWGWFLELSLSTVASYRFGLTWYSARMIGLVSSLFVLLMLLAQTSRLYAKTVLQITAKQWEQENRLMIRDAIAASVAHELRQPLAAIMLNAQTARRASPEPDDFVSSILDEIVTDSQRANDTIDSTRAIFGKAAGRQVPSNLNQLVRDVLMMVSRDLKRLRVTVDLHLDDRLPQLVVNRVQIQQVLFNLFTNAADAMGAATGSQRILTVRSGLQDGAVVIWIEDTGPGIPAGDQERIFEVFYTTKQHGTGLGLSICHSVIAAHGGALQLVPAARGAAFRIVLPCDGGQSTG